MSIVDPDITALDLPYKAEVHLVQHLLLCSVPLYYIARQRYPIYHRRHIFGSWMMTLYQWFILFPLAFPLNANINYVAGPPRRPPLLILGPIYRVAVAWIVCPVNRLTYKIWVMPMVRITHTCANSSSRFVQSLPYIFLFVFVSACFAVCELYLLTLYNTSKASVLAEVFYAIVGATTG